MGKKMGRRPKIEGERRRAVSISLGDTGIQAIRELASLRGQSQGQTVEEVVLRELAAERIRQDRKKNEKP